MGIFSTDYEKEAEELWKEVEKNLRPKDGLKHIVMINSVSVNKSTVNGKDKCADEYILKIDNVVEKIQKYGYEIIDIKIATEANNSIRTLIIYK